MVYFPVPFVPTMLPQHWEQKVKVCLGVDGKMEVSCDAPLSYTPGRFRDINNLVLGSGLPSSVAFPKALKESSRAIEEDSADDEEIFEVYDGEIAHSWDIDGICGFVPDYIPCPFLANINLDIDISTNPQIFTKKFVHKHLDLKDSCHIKLGSISSLWGPVSLFIVFNEREGGNYLALFLKNIAVLLERPPRENSELKGCVVSDEIPGFLSDLKSLYPGCSFFVEVFGTKSAISNKSFYAVFTKLFEIFDEILVPELIFDIALRTVPRTSKFLFMSNKSLERLHIRANYKLALCNLIMLNYKLK